MSGTNGKLFWKAVAAVGLLATLAGLFGCTKTPKPPKHKISDISSVSISCSHMDRCYGYYFWVRRDGDVWLFDATCFTNDHEVETVFENREVSSEDIDELSKILERNGSISYAENYKKPKKLPFEVMDETIYTFCLAFSDGSKYNTNDPQKELEQFFYRLAESAEQNKE